MTGRSPAYVVPEVHVRVGLLCVLALLAAASVVAQEPEHFQIRRATGPITIDGELNDPGWKDAVRIDRFYEIQPGDNTPPKVKTIAYVTYDDRFLYIGFRCDDPDPRKIRAHYVERDNVFSDQDFIGIMLDTK